MREQMNAVAPRHRNALCRLKQNAMGAMVSAMLLMAWYFAILESIATMVA